MADLGELVCLYERNGLSGHDWAMAGYDVWCYDISHPPGPPRIEQCGAGRKIFHHWDGFSNEQTEALIARHKGRAVFVIGFPPCTDLAVSGAKHFIDKWLANPKFQDEAMHLVHRVPAVAHQLGVPYMLENPVSAISGLWTTADYSFHPWEYGGYLPEDDVHPIFPQYYPPRDAYPKKTCLWVGRGFIMPPRRPVEPRTTDFSGFTKLGGKHPQRQAIRSISPRGFMRALYLANAPDRHLRKRVIRPLI